MRRKKAQNKEGFLKCPVCEEKYAERFFHALRLLTDRPSNCKIRICFPCCYSWNFLRQVDDLIWKSGRPNNFKPSRK